MLKLSLHAFLPGAFLPGIVLREEEFRYLSKQIIKTLKYCPKDVSRHLRDESE